MALSGSSTGFALLQVWGFDPLAWFGYGGLGGRVLRAVLLIGLTTLVGASRSGRRPTPAIERHLSRAVAVGAARPGGAAAHPAAAAADACC